MRKFVITTSLLVGLTTPVFASDKNPAANKPSDASAEVAMVAVISAETSGESTLSDVASLSESLEALVKPMGKKVEDCNGEVAAARHELTRLESALKTEEASLHKSFAEIKILKVALEGSGCKVLVGCRSFDRETVAQVMEQRIETYFANSEALKSLRESIATQKVALEASIAKQAKWQAKEKELLNKVELLENAHDELVNGKPTGVSSSVVANISLFQLEVTKMLGIKKTGPAKEAVPAAPAFALDADIEVEADVEVDAELDLPDAEQTLTEVEIILGDGK